VLWQVDDFNLYTYVGNDPLDKTDPSGNCPECIGALVGVGFEFIVQSAEIASGVRTDGYSGRDLAIAGIAGATGVGAAKFIGRATELGTLAKFAVNRLTDGAVSAGSQEAKKGEVSLTNVAIDVVAGGTLGEAVGAHAAAAAEKSVNGRVLSRQAGRAERIAAQNSRTAKQTAAQDARAAQVNNTASAAASAGAAASNAASSAVNIGCTVSGSACPK